MSERSAAGPGKRPPLLHSPVDGGSAAGWQDWRWQSPTPPRRSAVPACGHPGFPACVLFPYEPLTPPRLWDKLVACSVDCKQVLRIRRIVLEFLPQLEDLVIHGARSGIRVIAPYLIQQAVARQHPLRILGKEPHQLKLMRREHHLHTASPGDHLLKVQFAIAELIDRGSSRPVPPADGSLNACHDHPRAEWLCHV